MFNLEQSIAEWRRQMLAAGIKTPVPLDELESHLREEIERQMKSGLSEQKAFETASQRIGQPHVLKSEFQKARSLTFARIIAFVGIPAALQGLLMACLPVTHFRHKGTITNEETILLVVLFVLGMTEFVFGILLFFHGGGKVSWLTSAKPQRKYV